MLLIWSSMKRHTKNSAQGRKKGMQKLHSIQYLRAVAAIAVVLFHANIRIPNFMNPEFSEFFLRIGAAGVDLFFVISGFIMWVISTNRPRSPKEFILRRVARVVPLYWFVTLIFALLVVLGLSSREMDFMHVLKSLLFIPHYSPSNPDEIWPLLIPGWTLNYEMFFYGLFALCLFVPTQHRLIAILLSLLSLAAIGIVFNFENAILSTFTNPLLIEFVMGILIAVLWLKGHTPKGKTAIGIFLLGGLVLLSSLFINDEEETWRVLYWGIPCALIVLASLNFKLSGQLDKSMLLIGDASYSIYLSHVIFLNGLLKAWFMLPTEIFRTEAAALLFLLISVTCSCVIGIALYCAFEKPSEKWARKILIKNKA